MSAIDAYRRMVKTAASDERPHTMLPGRTTVSKRGSTGTIAPKIKKKKVAAEEEEPTGVTPIVVRAPGAPKAPKVDISFTVKVGAQQSITEQPAGYGPQPAAAAQGNTGTQVDGAFQPDSRIGGSYGTTSLPMERDSMRTPALPFGDNGDSEYVGDIKISAELRRALGKFAAPQPALPEPEEDDPSNKDLQGLLHNMKKSNKAFYEKQAADATQERATMNPAVAGGIAAAGVGSPFLGLIGESPIVHDPYYNANIKRMSMDDLVAKADVGDMAVYSRRKGSQAFKIPQEWSSGSEFFHSEPVSGRDQRGPLTMDAGELKQNKAGIPLSSRVGRPGGKAMYEDMVLLRPKKKMTPKQLANYQQYLAEGGQKAYGKDVATRAALGDLFIPKLKGLTDQLPTPGCGSSEICSTLPADAYDRAAGIKVSPSKASKSVMPFDYLRADSPFEAVGTSMRNPKNLTSPGKRLAKRVAIRGAIGAGVAGAGLGAYGLYNRFQNRNLPED